MFLFACRFFIGQQSNKHHWDSDSCCWSLLIPGLVFKKTKSKILLTIYWKDIETEEICEVRGWGGGEETPWDEYLFSMHHYCSKLQWWMAGSLINCLLVLSHHWAKEIFLPTSIDFSVAVWTRISNLFSDPAEDLNKITLYFILYYKYKSPFPWGWLFCICQKEEEQIMCDFEKNKNTSKLLGLTSKFILLFWSEKKLGNSAFG